MIKNALKISLIATLLFCLLSSLFTIGIFQDDTQIIQVAHHSNFMQSCISIGIILQFVIGGILGIALIMSIFGFFVWLFSSQN